MIKGDRYEVWGGSMKSFSVTKRRLGVYLILTRFNFAKRVKGPLLSTSWLPAATVFFFSILIFVACSCNLNASKCGFKSREKGKGKREMGGAGKIHATRLLRQ